MVFVNRYIGGPMLKLLRGHRWDATIESSSVGDDFTNPGRRAIVARDFNLESIELAP